MKSFVSLVIPCYNEEVNIEKVLKEAHRSLDYLCRRFEIVVVNDGSTDNTPQILARAAENMSSLRVVTHQQNRGYGGAVFTGLKSAHGDYVIMVDGDGQFDMRELSYMTKGLKYADIVIGYRIKRHDRWIRRVNSFIFNWAVRLVFGLWVKDINCSMKGFHKEVIDRLEKITPGALVNVDILTQSMHNGFKIVQVPVHHFFRTAGAATGGNRKVIVRSLYEFTRLFIREFPLRYKEFSFRQRTALGFLFAILVLLFSVPTFGIHFVIGFILALAGILVRNWAAGCVLKTKQIACSGPYAYVRHPLYMGSTLLGIGFCFMVSNRAHPIVTILFWSVFTAYILTVYRPKVLDEEKNLLKIFKDEYEEYMQTVPRYIPSGRRCRKNQQPFDWGVWKHNREYNSIIGFSIALAWVFYKLC